MLQEYNGINLLTVSKASDYKKYARTILRTLFTPDELSNSILIANPIYARPGLDTNRMAIWQGKLSISLTPPLMTGTELIRTI